MQSQILSVRISCRNWMRVMISFVQELIICIQSVLNFAFFRIFQRVMKLTVHRPPSILHNYMTILVSFGLLLYCCTFPYFSDRTPHPVFIVSSKSPDLLLCVFQIPVQSNGCPFFSLPLSCQARLISSLLVSPIRLHSTIYIKSKV